MTLRILSPALMACLALVAAGCGGGDDEPKRPAAASADQAFVDRMATHAEVSRQIADAGADGTKDAAVRKLAERMAGARQTEMNELRSLQQRLGAGSAGKDPLGVSPQEAGEELRPEALRGASPFDQVFLQLMIQHHQGALALIQSERESGKDRAVKALAEKLGQTRGREIAELGEQVVEAQARD